MNAGQATYMSSIDLAFKDNPEAVLVSADMSVTAIIIKGWRRAGYGGKIIGGSDISDTKQFVDLAGKRNLEGVYYTFLASDPNTIPFQIFQAKFITASGRKLGYGVPNCYDAMAIFLLALEAADEHTGIAITENVRKVANPPGIVVHTIEEGKAALMLGKEINYEGASGPCDFDDYGNVAGGYAKYIFNAEGKGELVKYYSPGSLE